MSEVKTALPRRAARLPASGGLRSDGRSSADRCRASWTGSGVYHHGDAGRGPLRRRLGGGPQAHPCRSPATKKGRCRLHRGASGSGGPAGERNGQYRHGERTKAAIAEQRKFSALLKLLRVTAFAMPILKRASRVV